MSGGRGGKGSAEEPAAVVAVRVLPRSSREGVAGVADGTIRIRLAAPPVEGRANEALIRFLAEALGVPRRLVELVAGERGRGKIVRVRGLTRRELFERLGLEQPP